VPHPQKFCIFCAGAGMSKEHYWPSWSADHFTAHDEVHTVMRAAFDGNLSPIGPASRKQQSGTVITRKLRIVCKVCNNSWMSSLENSAKPHLINLMHGRPTVLESAAVTAVAQWAILKAMVAENAEGFDPVSSIAQRQKFRLTRDAPHYGVWIGRVADWATHLRASRIRLEPEPGSPIGTPPFILQTTVTGFGALLIVALSTTVPGYEIEKNVGVGPKLTCIWPLPSQEVAWPPSAGIFSASDAEGLAVWFIQALKDRAAA
jgi:hypothetical protein